MVAAIGCATCPGGHINPDNQRMARPSDRQPWAVHSGIMPVSRDYLLEEQDILALSITRPKGALRESRI